MKLDKEVEINQRVGMASKNTLWNIEDDSREKTGASIILQKEFQLILECLLGE